MARWSSISIPRPSPRAARWKPRHLPTPCRSFGRPAQGRRNERRQSGNAQAILDRSLPKCIPGRDSLPDTVKAYDVVLKQKPELTDRTSYVIDRKGKIVMVHSDLDWKEHVSKTLAAVRALKQ